MLRALLILATVVAVLLGALMMLKRSRVPPPPKNLQRRYDEWEKEDEARGWKDKDPE